MTEHAQEEGVVPPRTFDFLAQGRGCGVTADKVEGELSEDRKVLGRVVFPSSVAILVEHDIEHPMQLVLDTPMGAHDVQQPLGGNIFGEQEVAYLGRLCAPTKRASARGDAGQRNDAGELLDRGESGIAQDGRAPPLAAIVSDGLAPFGNAAGSAARIAPSGRSKQLALALLERQHVIRTPLVFPPDADPLPVVRLISRLIVAPARSPLVADRNFRAYRTSR